MFKEDGRLNNTRHYGIGGLTVQVQADLPITDATFLPKFELFRVHPQRLPKAEGPDNDTVYIHHHITWLRAHGEAVPHDLASRDP